MRYLWIVDYGSQGGLFRSNVPYPSVMDNSWKFYARQFATVSSRNLATTEDCLGLLNLSKCKHMEMIHSYVEIMYNVECTVHTNREAIIENKVVPGYCCS